MNKVFTYTKRIIKEDHRVVRLFPKQMYDRYREVESIAYNIRKRLEHKTRVKVGLEDIELCTRMPDSGVWRRQRLPSNLPTIDLDCTSRPDMSLSPPPGRPGREEMLAEAVRGVLSSRSEMEEARAELAKKNEEKKRQLSSDSDSDENVRTQGKKGRLNKSGSEVNQGDLVGEKQGNFAGDNQGLVVGDTQGNRQVDSEGTGKEAELGLGQGNEKCGYETRQNTSSGQLDLGLFISQEAYSPLTPAKTKNIPDLTVILNSPVYHSKPGRGTK